MKTQAVLLSALILIVGCGPNTFRSFSVKPGEFTDQSPALPQAPKNKADENPKTEDAPTAPVKPAPVEPNRPPVREDSGPAPAPARPRASNIEFSKRAAARLFHASGKPRYNYTAKLKEKFGAALNQARPMESLSRKDQEKWTKIYNEIKKVATLKVGGEMRLLFIDKEDAKKRSEAFEKDRTISTEGAFTIATEATAVRHRFADRPCAEFMSEIIRQAYQRAGLSVHEDFSEANGNDLIFSKTAAVQGLGRALQKAGWTIWDLAEYSPIEGAILMHQIGGTPGHTYMAASEGGLIVRDNGSPMGRDLSAASLRTLQMMFRGGVFFLPPGQTPKKWAPN